MCRSNRFTVGNSETYAGGAAGGDEWKRRDAPKHAPYLEPVSPPDNHPANRYCTSHCTRRTNRSKLTVGNEETCDRELYWRSARNYTIVVYIGAVHAE